MRRIDALYPQALSGLLTYFKDPKNHADEDVLHVSQKELEGAKGKVSKETSEFIEALLHNSGQNYLILRSFEREGYFNDRELSLRDLYAARRGTSYYGKDISSRIEKFKAGSETSIEDIFARKNLIVAIISDATELREERTYLVELEFRKDEVTLDFGKMMKNEMATTYQEVVVGERTYNGWRIGQVLSISSDALGFMLKGELVDYKVSVNSKRIISQYFFVDKFNKPNEIPGDIYQDVIAGMNEGRRNMLVENYAGVTRIRVLNKPFSEYKIIKTAPLQRYFIRVSVQNQTLAFDLEKMMRNAATTHTIELEVPRSVYEQSGDWFNGDLNFGSFVFKGNLSSMNGLITKRWAEIDPNNLEITTAEGERFIVPAR